ncbi:hypothetical protein M427DRAFT_354056 [Gonapodya prolifera JEL478]|uniref:Uncharacterized protein n=1 Tax=Gonapodya prolifera (strain JEL478) TaxID=1344416 RepID=A0A139AC54_GONPJ|nr:hypothetical protein M427DRAFT_354056 [Gonapodya prolifera JEL478]|eukprot:KXS14360.1 hypothetical protein M427DRAFT_354056 [Gonapodya prolifera JEL478]
MHRLSSSSPSGAQIQGADADPVSLKPPVSPHIEPAAPSRRSLVHFSTKAPTLHLYYPRSDSVTDSDASTPQFKRLDVDSVGVLSSQGGGGSSETLVDENAIAAAVVVGGGGDASPSSPAELRNVAGTGTRGTSAPLGTTASQGLYDTSRDYISGGSPSRPAELPKVAVPAARGTSAPRSTSGAPELKDPSRDDTSGTSPHLSPSLSPDPSHLPQPTPSITLHPKSRHLPLRPPRPSPPGARIRVRLARPRPRRVRRVARRDPGLC